MRVVGRYVVFDEIASGGMAAVHLGRLLAEAGFSRTVAIKRLHPQLARDPDFVTMFLDEARLASRIRHPNVVQTLDIVTEGDEVLLVMEYVAGESLSRLARLAKPGRMPTSIAVATMTATLHGLHAAHEAKTEQGVPLALVHRDVSPQNILVGVDGVARVLDFGVAKATHRAQTTREGQIKGKLAYMAPEVLRRDLFDRRTDIYAAAVVLWEALAGRKLFEAETEARLVMKVLDETVEPPSAFAADVPPELDAIVMKGLARDPEHRFATAREMAVALERCGVVPAPTSVISEWVEKVAHDALAAKAARVAEIERSSDQGIPATPTSSRGFTPPPAVVPAHRAFAESATTLEAKEAVSTGVATATTLGGRDVPAPKSRMPIVFGLLAVLAVVGALGIGYGLASRRAPAAAAPPPPPTEASAIVSATPPAPVTEPSPPPTTMATETAKPAETAKAPEKKPAVAAPAPKPKAAPAPAPAPGKPDCRVPYTVDASGIRHIKPECM